MLLKLSSRGRINLPKVLREQLHWQTGDQVVAQEVDGKIILEKLSESPISALHGKLAGHDYLKDLA